MHSTKTALMPGSTLMPPPPTVAHGQAKATPPCSPELAGPLFCMVQRRGWAHLPMPGLPLPLTVPVTGKVRNRWALTSGLKGGSSMPASSLLKLRCLKRGCSFTSLAPAPRHPRRSKGSLHRSCDTKEINVKGAPCRSSPGLLQRVLGRAQAC